MRHARKGTHTSSLDRTRSSPPQMADADDGAAASATSPAANSSTDAAATFRLLVESADRKFARVRDLPPHGRGPLHEVFYRKVFKVYTRLWRFQQERRRELVSGGVRRWEIGEIASRIGQLYYAQYLRTSEVRFLLEAYVFYEAILNRAYFEVARGSSASDGKKKAADLGVRFKELRFHARFLIVALLLNRMSAVRQLADRFRALVDESKAAFPDTNFKEWKLVLHEIVRFLKADMAFENARPLRYNVLFDSHSSSHPYLARFHANRSLRLQDALITSYRRNEVKFSELTLDTFRMLQSLEWEPSGSFYQTPAKEPSENGALSDQSGASGLIDINLIADMTDPSLPPNPRKAVIYHPSVSQLIAVLAAICQEMSSDGILLIYLSASGKVEHNLASEKDVPGSSVNSKLNHTPKTCLKKDNSLVQPPHDTKSDSSFNAGNCISFGSRGTVGSNNLYPEDLIPFTRRPLFIIIDSDNSRAFKVLHGAERGEPSALLLSHEKPTYVSDTDLTSGGSQFTYFLTCPLQAFCQLVGLSFDIQVDTYEDAESLLSSALAELEVALCTSKSLGQVWAQVLPDPFLRRLILRFIFCRAVLFLVHPVGDNNQHLPECLPSLPESVSPKSAIVQISILRLVERLGVAKHFHFLDSTRDSVQQR